ncbi:hypothetical protein ACWGB8_12420 [Kitasatospora sp. NPDC054939]
MQRTEHHMTAEWPAEWRRELAAVAPTQAVRAEVASAEAVPAEVADAGGLVVFGSDGGGLLFAADRGGRVHRSLAASSDVGFEPWAESLPDFLTAVLRAVVTRDGFGS